MEIEKSRNLKKCVGKKKKYHTVLGKANHKVWGEYLVYGLPILRVHSLEKELIEELKQEIYAIEI